MGGSDGTERRLDSGQAPAGVTNGGLGGHSWSREHYPLDGRERADENLSVTHSPGEPGGEYGARGRSLPDRGDRDWDAYRPGHRGIYRLKDQFVGALVFL